MWKLTDDIGPESDKGLVPRSSLQCHKYMFWSAKRRCFGALHFQIDKGIFDGTYSLPLENFSSLRDSKEEINNLLSDNAIS